MDRRDCASDGAVWIPENDTADDSSESSSSKSCNHPGADDAGCSPDPMDIESVMAKAELALVVGLDVSNV